jgi:hypothetical protein
VQQATVTPKQLGLVETLAGKLHSVLVFTVTIGVQDNLNAVGVPGGTTRLAINQLCCPLQIEALPLRGKVMSFGPIVQVAQEYLQIKQDLIFLQMTLAA